MAPHALTNFWKQKYYPNKFKFHVIHSRNNLPEIKEENM